MNDALLSKKKELMFSVKNIDLITETFGKYWDQ
jgi:hypothetical protein